MAGRIITLTTDFGPSSPYVAALKGVILNIHPEARIVDITHAIAPQAILRAAIVLAETTPWFPVDSVHLAVVDPGVGTDRRILYAQIGRQHYVAPDNGLLSRLASRTRPSKIVSVDNPTFWLRDVSATFHGRDIMAPVAAHLSLGLAPDELGDRREEIAELDWPEVEVLENQIEGQIVSVDSFGNLITDITAETLDGVPVDESVTIECDEHETMGIFATYADQPALTLIALINSSSHLELAIVNENAAAMLGVSEGAKVTVRW